MTIYITSRQEAYVAEADESETEDDFAAYWQSRESDIRRYSHVAKG